MAQPRKNAKIVDNANNKKRTQVPRGTGGAQTQQGRDARIARTMWGVVVFGLGLFMLVSLMMEANAPIIRFTRELLQASAGFLCLVLPFMVCGIGVMLAFTTPNSANTKRVLLILGLFVLLTSCVQLFDVKRIVTSQRWAIEANPNYFTFIQLTALLSGAQAVGGGVIGALLAWPMWSLLDVWGALLVFIILMMVDLVILTGTSFTNVGGSVSQRWQAMREEMEARRDEKEQLRAEEEARRERERLQMYQRGKAPQEEPPASHAYEEQWAPEPAKPRRAGRGKAASAGEPILEIHEDTLEETSDAYPYTFRPKVQKAGQQEKAGTTSKRNKSRQNGMYMETLASSGGQENVEEDELGEDLPPVVAFPRRERTAGKPAHQPRIVSGQSLYIETLDDSFGMATLEDEPLAPPPQQAEVFALKQRTRAARPEKRVTEAIPDEEEEAQQTEARADFPWDEEPAWGAETSSVPLPWERARPQAEAGIEAEGPRPVARRLDQTPITLPTKEERATEPQQEPYRFPPMNLLKRPERASMLDTRRQDTENAAKLIETLRSFGIQARVLHVTHGPAITRYELQPAPGVKVSRIVSLVDDIALNMAAAGVRIEAPIPGKAAIGIEIPNESISTVMLREVLESEAFGEQPSSLACALGKDIAGRRIIADLAKMPHILIAGATGSGKSVCINTLISSLIYRASPEEVRMILIDPKVVELSVYNGIPHLLVPVVTDPKKASGALSWAVSEMERRYKEFAARGVRDIRGFNATLQGDEPMMPKVVVIIDELADLMMVAPGEVEDSICRLAQLARAAGIHLVIATQRPSVNVITGVIKANIPSRIAFAVSSQVDSRTILDAAGAEKLLGKGDMLYAPQGAGKPTRVQGCFVSDEEVAAVVAFVKKRHSAEYSEDVIEHLNQLDSNAQESPEAEEVFDELLAEAVSVSVEMGQTSISMLQRKLRVGYARAGRLIDEMTRRGIISEAEGAKPRDVLMSREEYRRLFEME